LGSAFSTAELPETALAEVAHHGVVPTTGIRFELNLEEARILDLGDAAVADRYGYLAPDVADDATRSIGSQAVADGYNTIRFPSLRGEGSNYAVLDDFDTVLSPQMITPVEGAT
jgi:hypothetical protein